MSLKFPGRYFRLSISSTAFKNIFVHTQHKFERVHCIRTGLMARSSSVINYRILLHELYF